MKFTKIIFGVFVLLLIFPLFHFVLAKNDNPPSGLDNKPQLEKKVFIHYKKGYNKSNDILKPAKIKTVSCYDFLAKGLSWKTLPVNLYLGTNLPAGVGESSFINALTE